MFERIPDELKALKQWHCWKYSADTKIPVQVNGAAAKSNDPSTWSDFESALDAAQFHSGLAFEITEPFCGIDLDDCIDDNGLKPWAIEILFKFDGLGFAEISPSGTGIKILTRARKPDGSRSVRKFSDGQIECYDNRRFWTVTGDIYAGQDEIKDGQAAVDWFCKNFLTNEDSAAPKPLPVVPRLSGSSLERRVESYLKSISSVAEGGRNQAAFSLAGHLRSFEHDGQRLAEDQVLDYCRDWNSRNSPPLSDEELQRAVSSSGRNGTPRERKADRPLASQVYPEVDLSKILGEERGEDFDDEEFCLAAVPRSGLLKQVFDYYCLTSHRTSAVMGLAVAVSLCETLFGRRIASHTDMRTNDYNVIMAPTSSGKEACEKVIGKIFNAAGNSPLLPPSVQSGNGLLKAINAVPCGIWVCDEFGKVLEAILDKKGNGHARQIGTYLLQLYSKSDSEFGGAAHADGIRNRVQQPHLVLLGLTTGQVFDTVDSKQVQDGLFGRLAFWPVQTRPKRKAARAHVVPEDLSLQVREWMLWEPSTGNLGVPDPEVVEMTPDAEERWNRHADAIDERMEHESESRAAIWGRVAGRAMKLALVHRAARIHGDPAAIDWQEIRIEMPDVDWGVKLANWLARIACGLIRENIVDTQANKARAILLAAVEQLGEVCRTALLREFRSVSGSEFTAAAEALAKEGKIEEVREKTTGRTKTVYKKSGSAAQNKCTE